MCVCVCVCSVCSVCSVILSVLDPRKCEYLKDYSSDFEHAYTWCGYKITGLMLEHLLFKKLHNINVTLNVLPSAIPSPLHANFPLLETVLQVVL